MHRIDSANARPNANGVGKTGYHLNTDLFGVEPTSLTPDALNAIQEEICNTIEATGSALVKGSNNQLLLAIRRLSVDATWRVGMVVEFATDEDPNTTWPWSTWVRFAEGQTTVGQLDDDDDFGVIGDTGGSKTQSLDEEQMPPHVHGGVPLKQVQTDRGTGSSIFSIDDEAFTDSAGGLDGVAQPFSILQPFVVTAKWRRTA